MSCLTPAMDFLQMKHLKRKRKSNYSVKETQTLIREIHKRRDVLFSRQQNTAINELKRRAWDEVADCVNALGEGELRTAAEVKRRYLDWRALMKRKQIRAELASGLKSEYEQPCLSPDENEASLSGGDQSLDVSGFAKEAACDWQDLSDLGEPSSHTPSGVKMEDDDANGYSLEGDTGGEGEGDGEEDDDDCFPSILPDIDREGRVPEVFAHIDEFGMLSSSKASSVSAGGRDLGLGVGIGVGMSGVGISLGGASMGMGLAGMGLGGAETTGLLITLEKQRLDLEKHRLQVESERLAVEKERLLLEKERLRQAETDRERLQLERERLQVERERLRLLMCQTAASAQHGMPSSTSAATPSTSSSSSSSSSSAPTSSTLEGDKDRKPFWHPAMDFETEKLKLEKERLMLEKERLQFFKFESGRLAIEKERLQVEKERLQLHKDGQQMALHQGH
ncbi:myb/SANT-like DNA-binding domain-containing protein 4 [Clupea harengus]|uniref:Myb/SANT-like DNA-binding domain-containing protein 4 n=1 Tax=Clupea harengus TaxID=7950 RepID=A0A6P3WA65_CLUHA|nr:myb/SANT-like DNA-binding domain-containing protein 4 [Clupea harengus]XP_031428959.1 myb/SANT-like DNA-binding domain-containing protein 4 [Clupea harengus]